MDQGEGGRYEIQLMLSMRPHDASNNSDGPPVLKLPDHVNDVSAINVHNQKAGITREQNRIPVTVSKMS